MTTTCKSCGSQIASDSAFCTKCGSALIPQDPEVQRIQAELNNVRKELELNEVKEKIDSISERLKEAEEHLSKLKSEDISASESNTLSADEQRVERLQMQLLIAQEIAELRAELEAATREAEEEQKKNLSYTVIRFAERSTEKTKQLNRLEIEEAATREAEEEQKKNLSYTVIRFAEQSAQKTKQLNRLEMEKKIIYRPIRRIENETGEGSSRKNERENKH